MKIAFDVDGTLIRQDDTPYYYVLDILFWFIELQEARLAEIYVWSGGGIEYAQHWVDKLGLKNNVKVIEKGSIEVDIAVDDEEIPPEGVKAKVIIKV